MSNVASYLKLQDRPGKDQAETVAEYYEQHEPVKFSSLATSAELAVVKTDLAAVKADLAAVKAELKADNKDLRLYFEQKLHDLEMSLNSRMQWTAFVQILTTVAAIIALAKFLK